MASQYEKLSQEQLIARIQELEQRLKVGGLKSAVKCLVSTEPALCA
jgi:hypothetical protein